jgi:hypothetical protein
MERDDSSSLSFPNRSSKLHPVVTFTQFEQFEIQNGGSPHSKSQKIVLALA